MTDRKRKDTTPGELKERKTDRDKKGRKKIIDREKTENSETNKDRQAGGQTEKTVITRTVIMTAVMSES